MTRANAGRSSDGLNPNELLKVAQFDLEAACELARKGLWPHAVFHLQQSVEKTAKSLAVATSLVAAKALQSDVKHDLLAIPAAVIEREDILRRLTVIAERRAPLVPFAESLAGAHAATARARQHLA